MTVCLLTMHRSRLASIPRRVAWYPGSSKKYLAFKSEFKDAEELGIEVENGQQHVEYHPWLLRADLRPEEVKLPSADRVYLTSHYSNSEALYHHECAIHTACKTDLQC